MMENELTSNSFRRAKNAAEIRISVFTHGEVQREINLEKISD
jgi:hypothetical protein